MSKVISGFLEYLGKVAAASLVFWAVACTAGYIETYGRLSGVGADWFLGFYSYVDLGVRGASYAIILFFVTLIIVTVNYYEMISENVLRIAMFFLGSPMVAWCGYIFYKVYKEGALAVSNYNLYGAAGLCMIVVVVVILLSIYKAFVNDNFYRIIIYFFAVAPVTFMLILVPILKGLAEGSELRSEEFSGLPEVYDQKGDEVFRLIAATNGRFLIFNTVDKGGSFSVVDPSNGWRVSFPKR